MLCKYCKKQIYSKKVCTYCGKKQTDVINIDYFTMKIESDANKPKKAKKEINQSRQGKRNKSNSAVGKIVATMVATIGIVLALVANILIPVEKVVYLALAPVIVGCLGFFVLHMSSPFYI